ncbi:hypothetical protein J4E86_003244 [Alternaria arbusti]|uniref:uncharacterized protein n=1 Tax=Alternaria arbusti TaxID=232088 RepID=UPI00222017A6|nr:uncharacterized protein J4E86_003244 [Alternaria arbusti]KAI4959522.1 hypothetical protein J4E86_003244 [Alternaria arbusti]
MKRFTLLVILTSATVTMARCFPDSGQKWATEACKDAARGAIRDLCNSGRFAGYFNQGETKYACAECPYAGIKFDFAVGWQGRGGLTLNKEDCIKRLTDEVNGCQAGGEKVTADWLFRSDPNTGRC